ncbi:hypothetical protein HD554DRAFT_2205118 [Boletus coccyginus]|nr:hypothetical protein HD554DRAFT_2205118 [Boletus coccyginus]
MVHHPNFPPSLSITPNISPFTNKTSGRSPGGDGGDAFGIEAQREAISRYGIAGRVWEAAYALCAYVDPVDDSLGVIELGSGTGVVAASVARAIRRAVMPGGFVIATDLPDVCPLLATEPRKQPLAWGNLVHATSIASEFGSRRLTHIVCSDLVYFPELLGPLLRTLIHLTSPSFAPSSGLSLKIVISYKIRSLSKETPFWSAFGLWFSFQPVLDTPPDDESDAPWKQFAADEDADQTFVFVAYRQPESIAWNVPETDKELMEGVGARGTTSKKGDDTFETILFMAMAVDNTSG